MKHFIMRLKQLKLAGFKSFVDPTIVTFPSQLVAVVGPNGCGKSNIIDAVRWVLGESSAKNLRGGSMTDVIFNGSAQRKSVGQASVELIFDNNAGRLTGPFSSYAEIAVKRLVTRDGESAYFLNGNKCRRKDITDIFLGTGAGAKGYSIIGQGTVSELIEAKPEELRIFLEEAAGVSKYKERRRETLQKIAQTREHLTRVIDIRNELEKQVQRLARQAQSAKRYLELKDKEKNANAEILAFKWQELTHKHQVKLEELNQMLNNYEQQQSILTGYGTEHLLSKEKLQSANELYENTQSAYYALGNDITRLEAQIQKIEQEKKYIEQNKQKMQDDGQNAKLNLEQNYQTLTLSQQKTEDLEKTLQELKEQFQKINQEKLESQQNYKLWQTVWTELQNSLNKVQSQLKISQVNLHHLEQKGQSSQLRINQIQQEQTNFSLKELENKKYTLREKQDVLEEQVERDELQLKDGMDLLHNASSQFQEVEQQLQQLRDKFHHMNSELAALQVAQSAALQKNKFQNYQDTIENPKLLDVLEVAPEWQFLCGRILNEALHSYVIEDFEAFCSENMAKLEHYGMALSMRPVKNKSTEYPKLVDHIKGQIPKLIPDLESIYLAEDLQQALSWLSNLKDQESVVTPEGIWLGKGWVKWVGAQEQVGVDLLVNKQKIKDLTLEINTLQLAIDDLIARRELLQKQIQECRLRNETFQSNLFSSKDAANTNYNEIKANDQALEYGQKLQLSWDKELLTLEESLKQIEIEISKLRGEQMLFEEQFKDQDQQQLNYLKEKEKWTDLLIQQTKELEAANDSIRESEMTLHKEMLKFQQVKETIEKEKEVLDKLYEDLEDLELKKRQLNIPEGEIKEKLEESLSKYTEIELQWVQNKEQAAHIKEEISILEKKILKQELEIKAIQEVINQTKMQEQELVFRAEGFKESLTALGFQPASILEQLSSNMNLSSLEEQLLSLTDQIKRLGAINLAAIEEFAIEQERMLYLDGQHEDLNQALALLETAIEQIDKETLARLEHTFNEVNNLFKALFPRLFGGGSAQLVLTCDNLLESGIVVMAQPPGKRNSSIHLLSGGEKAMTAVALVFAIFQLNPSPFCMLDEVDAPLDDANVERFCDLVKEMSQFIQFLFITHNKVTMKLADHLIGVTMREPGVSRLVAVDVKEALMTE